MLTEDDNVLCGLDACFSITSYEHHVVRIDHRAEKLDLIVGTVVSSEVVVFCLLQDSNFSYFCIRFGCLGRSQTVLQDLHAVLPSFEGKRIDVLSLLYCLFSTQLDQNLMCVFRGLPSWVNGTRILFTQPSLMKRLW